jgi:hypothetical protein
MGIKGLSICGINCDECKFTSENNCNGCRALEGKTFWSKKNGH